jgi:hypothetical protein
MLCKGWRGGPGRGLYEIWACIPILPLGLYPTQKPAHKLLEEVEGLMVERRVDGGPDKITDCRAQKTLCPLLFFTPATTLPYHPSQRCRTEKLDSNGICASRVPTNVLFMQDPRVRMLLSCLGRWVLTSHEQQHHPSPSDRRPGLLVCSDSSPADGCRRPDTPTHWRDGVSEWIRGPGTDAEGGSLSWRLLSPDVFKYTWWFVLPLFNPLTKAQVFLGHPSVVFLQVLCRVTADAVGAVPQ